MKIAGLDLETTGIDPTAGHRIIQIGIAFPDKTVTGYDILPEGDINISAEALGVNHFTLERIGRATKQSHVDAVLADELKSRGYTPGSIHAIGWNVGSFDLNFVRMELPKIAGYFSHRCIDLTGIAMLKAVIDGGNYRDLKEQYHSLAAQALSEEHPQWHDAVWDARAALKVYQMMTEEFR